VVLVVVASEAFPSVVPLILIHAGSFQTVLAYWGGLARHVTRVSPASRFSGRRFQVG
jgi:hypothetical protein